MTRLHRTQAIKNFDFMKHWNNLVHHIICVHVLKYDFNVLKSYICVVNCSLQFFLSKSNYFLCGCYNCLSLTLFWERLERRQFTICNWRLRYNIISNINQGFNISSSTQSQDQLLYTRSATRQQPEREIKSCCQLGIRTRLPTI